MPRPIFSHPMVFREPRSTAAGTGPSGGGGVTVSPTPPGSAAVGDLWWRDTDGVLYVWYDDGTSQQWVPASPQGLSNPRYYLLAGSLAGVPNGGMSLASWVAVLPFTLPTALAGSQARAKGAATGTAHFDVAVNGVSQGSIQWAASATVATFSFVSAVAIAIGDRIDVTAGSPADATLSDPVWTLRGTL